MTDVTLKRIGYRVLLGIALSGSVAPTLAQDRVQAEQKLSAVSAAIESIQGWLTQASSRQSDEEARLRETVLELSNAQQAYASLSASVAAKQAELAELQQQLATLESRKAEEQQLLQTLLRAAHLGADSNFLKMLLNREQSGSAARQLHYAQRLVQLAASVREAMRNKIVHFLPSSSVTLSSTTMPSMAPRPSVTCTTSGTLS